MRLTGCEGHQEIVQKSNVKRKEYKMLAYCAIYIVRVTRLQKVHMGHEL